MRLYHAAILALLLLSGCESILGLDDFGPAPVVDPDAGPDNELLRFRAVPNQVDVPLGGSVAVPVEIDRPSDFDQVVTILVQESIEGLTSTEANIAPAEDTAELILHAGPGLSLGETRAITLRASGGDESTTAMMSIVIVAGFGTLDPAFGDAGLVLDNAVPQAGQGARVEEFIDVVVFEDGSFAAVGVLSLETGSPMAVIKYSAAGVRDISFGDQGATVVPFFACSPFDGGSSLALAADGGLIVSGFQRNSGDADFTVARLDPDGSFDGGFANNGIFRGGNGEDFEHTCGVTIDDQQRIVGVGIGANEIGGGTDIENSQFVAFRLLSGGQVDNSFSGDGIIDFGAADEMFANDVAIDSQNRIVVAAGALDRAAAVRLLANGTLDNSFGDGGIVVLPAVAEFEFVSDIVLDDDDGLILSGSWFNGEPPNVGEEWLMRKLDADGNIASEFGDGGSVLVSRSGDISSILDLIRLPDGSFMALGSELLGNTAREVAAISRFSAEGALDPFVGQDGFAQIEAFVFAHAGTLHGEDGVIIVGGGDDGALVGRIFR
ncbi:delta-60 repeat domain-containing protein [Haliangium ochraceum]|uniref:Uncharacterized protein n=1 Tax=Haliangium ochraceum (strain DSM 14365 / JCM 11303 / SMP-2) TaxID=502025 RepID=D0LQ78_HALO1|nr:delta-60 repeat domain-containing protein [Haliangium ochraceum]ACY18887.1 hypothetical protein Hoch_6418 [Haliangium ochraceum DSM 14365]